MLTLRLAVITMHIVKTLIPRTRILFTIPKIKMPRSHKGGPLQSGLEKITGEMITVTNARF